MPLERRAFVLCLTALSAGAACKGEARSSLSLSPTSMPEATPAQAPVILPCADGMAHIGEFCIDRYEAHLVDVDAPASVLPHFERPRPGIKIMAVSAAGVWPQAYINRSEAAHACKAAKKRLCDAHEWYRACSGRRGSRYPYGDKPLAGRCNTGKPHLMTKLFGATTDYKYEAHYNNPRLNQEPGFLAVAGEYAGCVGEESVYDLVGNLHEWVADFVTAKLGAKVPLEFGSNGLGREGSGVFMGGYFSSKSELGRGCAYVTATHAPDYHDYSIGFRCCADAAPSR